MTALHFIPSHLRTTDVCSLTHSPLVVDALRDAGATDEQLRDVLLALFGVHRDEDWPRLCFADWCEEHGDATRAEFVRIQCRIEEMKRLYDSISPLPDDHPAHAEWRELRHREDCILRFPCVPGGKTNREYWFSPFDEVYNYRRGDFGQVAEKAISWDFSRGFVSSLTLPWQDWLANHRALYWHPESKDACPKCRWMREHLETHTSDNAARLKSEQCGDCSGTARVPRQFVRTAMPLELVTFSTDMGWYGSHLPDTENARRRGGHDFDRMKCPTCDAHGVLYAPSEDRPETHTTILRCHECNGHPVNRWACPSWPGLEFAMPTEQTR